MTQFIAYGIVFAVAWIVSSLSTKARMKKAFTNVVARITDIRHHPVVELTQGYKAGWADCISAVNRALGDL